MASPAPQSLVNQLVLEKLDKLDEKLRGLTDIYWDIRYRLDTVERRLGDMDGKVDRRLGDMEGALGRRLDKLSEAVAAHDHKDSSAKDQLGRKVDNVYERVVYMDNNSVNKLQQTIVDKAASASAELQRAVAHADQAVGKAAAAGLSAVLAVHARLNATHDLVLNTSRATAAAAATTTSQDDAEESEAGQRACVDASDTAAKTIKQHIDTKTDLMSSKVSKLYNDMWRRVNELESTVKTVISLSNATRRDVQALNVAALGAQHGRGYSPRQPAQESGLEYALNLHDDSVGRQLSGLRDALLDELQNVQVLQNTFLATCNRLNDKDLDVEDKLGRVLTHHTTYLLEHRQALGDFKRQLKTHSTLAGRAAANATEGTKRVESVVRGLADQSRRMEEALARLHSMTAAVQNATDKAAAGCGAGLGRLGAVEEEAAWSALLQHNATLDLAEPTERDPQSATPGPAEDEEPRATPTSEEHQRDGREAPTTAAAATATGAGTYAADSGELVLVDSNGLQRQSGPSAPRHEAAEDDGDVNGLQGQAGGPAGRREGHDDTHVAQDQQERRDGAAAGLADSGQDGMTDLSSVDDEDYTEENDDETDFID